MPVLLRHLHNLLPQRLLNHGNSFAGEVVAELVLIMNFGAKITTILLSPFLCKKCQKKVLIKDYQPDFSLPLPKFYFAVVGKNYKTLNFSSLAKTIGT